MRNCGENPGLAVHDHFFLLLRADVFRWRKRAWRMSCAWNWAPAVDPAPRRRRPLSPCADPVGHVVLHSAPDTHFDAFTRKASRITSYGLCHPGANDHYRELTGRGSSVRSGGLVDTDADAFVGRRVAKELGHSRPCITTHYLWRREPQTNESKVFTGEPEC